MNKHKTHCKHLPPRWQTANAFFLNINWHTIKYVMVSSKRPPQPSANQILYVIYARRHTSSGRLFDPNNKLRLNPRFVRIGTIRAALVKNNLKFRLKPVCQIRRWRRDTKVALNFNHGSQMVFVAAGGRRAGQPNKVCVCLPCVFDIVIAKTMCGVTKAIRGGGWWIMEYIIWMLVCQIN